MATYSVQFITHEGAFGGSPRILNRAKTLLQLQEAWPPSGCVVIVAAAGNQRERLKLRGLATAQVFHERVRAMDWLTTLLPEEPSI